MALYVERPLAPPPGVDWSYMIPGQYLERITGITATLTTPATLPTVMHDRSGNGNDGNYTYTPAVDPLSPGFFAGANRVNWFEDGGAHFSYATTSAGCCDITSAFSFDCWVQGDPTQSVFDPIFAFGGPIAIGIEIFSNGSIIFQYSDGTFFQQRTCAAGSFPFDGAAHHFGCSYSGVAMAIYVDGIAVAGVTIGAGGTTPGLVTNPELGRQPITPGGLGQQFVGQPAFYQSVLGAGTFAAHAAAGTSLAAYSAAVLASSPVSYYDLDDETVIGGRTPGLVVTDGTSEVVLIPDGFTAQTTPGPYAYSWLPTLSSDTRDPTGTITSVAIPKLLLPAGYTVGTRTPDLTSGDQWSDISVWWDDDVMRSVSGVDRFVYPPGAYLTLIHGA